MFDVTSKTRDNTSVIILKSRLTLLVILPARASYISTLLLYAHLQHQNDTIIKTQWQRQTHAERRRKTSLTIFTSHFIARVERVVQGLRVRGSWRPYINCNILTPNLWPSRCVFLVLLMLGSTLLHLISIFSGPQTPSGFPRAPSVGCGFPYHISSPTVWNSTGNFVGPLGVELNWNRNSIQLARRTQLNYIIVRRPLDLWNRMFNRHHAEITVMQFRGNSLPVHHSVVYHGNFF